MMTQQHYRMTLGEAISLHQHGLISSTALLYCYLKIRLAPGWKMTLHQREISQQLGISKAAFYKGIQRLKDKKLIDWEAPNGLVVSLGQNGDSLDKSETSLDKMETSLDKMETFTLAKPSPGKASSDSSDSYQIFFKSLSDSVREKFLIFVKEKVKDFNPPINDIEAWLAGKNQAGKERSCVYYEMFQKEVGEGIAPSQDWENHPNWEQALTAMRIGVPRFIVKGEPDCEDIDPQTRRRMADYAQAKNLIWAAKP